MGEWKALKKASGTGWKELERESGTGWKELAWESGYEDFTTFTEVDPNSHITVDSGSKITFTNLARNEDCYIYKDYGVGHFTDFTHKTKIRRIASSNAAIAACWSLSNYVDDLNGLCNANRTVILAYIYEEDLMLREYYNGVKYTSTNHRTLTANTDYWLKMVKSGTSMNLYIYSDSGYSNLLTTCTLTLHADHSLRYLFAVNSYNSGNSYSMSGINENFDIGE